MFGLKILLKLITFCYCKIVILYIYLKPYLLTATSTPASPGVNKVRKTVVMENGQIVEQNNTYNPDTGEVSLAVPPHGDYEDATIIMDTDSVSISVVSKIKGNG